MSDISSDHKWVFWLEDRRVSKVILHVILHKLKNYNFHISTGKFSQDYVEKLGLFYKEKTVLVSFVLTLKTSLK